MPQERSIPARNLIRHVESKGFRRAKSSWHGFCNVSAMKKHAQKLSCLPALLILLASGPALGDDANPWHSLEAIRLTAEHKALEDLPAGGSIHAKAGHLDRRLHLAACTAPLQAEVLGSGRPQSKITVKVSCAGPKRWKVHVPVDVTRTQPVVIAIRPISRDTIFSEQDVGLAEKDVTSLPGVYYTELGQVLGLRAVRSVKAGQVVSDRVTGAAPLVHKGQAVTIEALTGGVQIRMAGRALTDGAQSQRIQVMNLSSNRTVEAIVKSNQVVEVLLH